MQTRHATSLPVVSVYVLAKDGVKGGGVTSDTHMVSKKKKNTFFCLDFKLQAFAQKHFLRFDFKLNSKQ